MTRVQQVGDQIEELLAGLAASRPGRRGRGTGPAAGRPLRTRPGPHRRHAVRRGRRRAATLGLAGRRSAGGRPLHGLHPLDVDTRIQRALDRVRPDLGLARRRCPSTSGSLDGWPCSGWRATATAALALSTVTVQLAIEVRCRTRRRSFSEGRGGGGDGTARTAGTGAAADRVPPRGGCGARGPGRARKLGHAAPVGAAERAARQHDRRGHGDPRLLGPRDAVRLPRGVRGLRRLRGFGSWPGRC